MGRHAAAKSFFQTTCDEIVYFRNVLLFVILGTRIYQILTVTLPFKEWCITQHCYQTNRITTDSKLETTKVNASSNRFEICDNGSQSCHNIRLWTIGISSVTLIFEGGIISCDILIEGTSHFPCGPNRSRKTQDSRRLTKTPNSHYGINVRWSITKTLLNFGSTMFN